VQNGCEATVGEVLDRLVERLESAASANARDSSIRRLPPDLRDQPTRYRQEHPALGDRLDWKPPSSTKPARLADEFPSLLGNFTSQTLPRHTIFQSKLRLLDLG
jgi:hypothetical protein